MMCQSTDYNGIYADIFEIFRDEITRQFHHHFKGHQICCPMRLHSKEYIRKYLVQYYDGKNIREIATYLGYSERWIKQLLVEELK